ncbi:hypothetical protein BC830DRAFT_1105966 [Chytriomyces sp. MP71]|nr:hypothetical protein BC830DRAFT_1105966 [Chytriomyces sp. MP71]
MADRPPRPRQRSRGFAAPHAPPNAASNNDSEGHSESEVESARASSTSRASSKGSSAVTSTQPSNRTSKSTLVKANSDSNVSDAQSSNATTARSSASYRSSYTRSRLNSNSSLQKQDTSAASSSESLPLSTTSSSSEPTSSSKESSSETMSSSDSNNTSTTSVSVLVTRRKSRVSSRQPPTKRRSGSAAGRHPHLHIDTGMQSADDLPPLPSSPVPKHRPEEEAKKKVKLKVTSPTTGASVTVAETDLLIPSASPRRATPNLRDSPTTPEEVHAFEMHEVEQQEKREETERIRALLSSSAALAGHGRKGKKHQVISDAHGGDGERLGGHSGPDLALAAESAVGPVLESGDPDILFVDDGSRFRHLKRLKGGLPEDEATVSFDDQLRRLCMKMNRSTSHTLHTSHGIYAGLCLLSIAIFPNTTVPFFSPLAGLYYPVLQFVAFYSGVSTPTSRIFSVIGTLSVLSTLDGGFDHQVGDGMDRASQWWSYSGKRLSTVGAVRWWRRRSGRIKRIAAILAVVCTFISYVASIVMVPVDDRLYESQVGLYGGIYGGQNWFANSTLSSDQSGHFVEVATYSSSPTNSTFSQFYPLAGTDIAIWQNLNCARGVLGLVGWMFCSLSRMLHERRRIKHENMSGDKKVGKLGAALRFERAVRGQVGASSPFAKSEAV